MSAGKGDKYRPVNAKVYGENYDSIFRKNLAKDEVSEPGLFELEYKLKQLQDEYNDLPKKASFSGLHILNEIEEIQHKIDNYNL